MQKLPGKLMEKLDVRASENCLRKLPVSSGLIDFSSNDYLGFAKNGTIYSNTFQLLLKKDIYQNGATGSRLLTGNHNLYVELEDSLADLHSVESAMVFNSGYDANVGFFACVPQRDDFVLYDELIHASIRDGIRMGNAKSYKYKHNDLGDLKRKIEQIIPSKNQSPEGGRSEVYVATESVFSMDGDSPDLKKLAAFCTENNFWLILDEAHAMGIIGKSGKGLANELGLQNQIFASIVTFGKALGSHGAAILGNTLLKNYLVNYSRPFMYSTALSPHAIATILSAYRFMEMEDGQKQRNLLQENIKFFKDKLQALQLENSFISSNSAIQCCVVSGNQKLKLLASKLSDDGFDVKPILSPTVPEGSERLRFCIHSYNSKEEMGLVLQLLSSYL